MGKNDESIFGARHHFYLIRASHFDNKENLKIDNFGNQFPDGYRFNRGSSFNAGFHIITKEFPKCDYIALHDVDIIPLTDEVSYAYPGNAAYHAIPPESHPVLLYSMSIYFGGIVLMSK